MGTYKKQDAMFDIKISTMQKKVAEDQANIFASEKDREVFFDALMNPPKPSEELLKAADVYEKYMSK